ncbi:hypothetical protein B296_00024123 [Ensete ventricosum]|uniref:Uncharacterized protein n=1 Tax=Ensete ventricosum TaxID=4639 RepID=A0A427AD10_ENSVE|nr:hypothetical protein B296_00024123 [Ensete ventricosum]
MYPCCLLPLHNCSGFCSQKIGMKKKMVNGQLQPFQTPSTRDPGSKRYFKDDPYIYAFSNLRYVGIELWQAEKAAFDEAEKSKQEEVCWKLLHLRICVFYSYFGGIWFVLLTFIS